MIGGISSQVGFTEEKPDLLNLRPPPDKGFDRVLRRATDPRREASEPSTTASEPRHDVRRRALFEEREEAPAKAGEDGASPGQGEKVAGEERKKLPSGTSDAPSAQGRDSIQTRAPSEPPSEAEQAVAYPGGTVLEEAEIDLEQAARSAQAIHLSGIGLVAYQQATHGVGEEEAAAGQGLTLMPPAKRADTDQLQVAAQAVQAGELLEKVEPEQQLPTKTPREQFPHLVDMADPEELPEEALDKALAKSDSKNDSGRLALLNAMRQPPPGTHAAHAGALGLESGAGLKEGKTQGGSGENGRAAIQTVPRGADPAQMQATVPNLAAPERGGFAVLQKPDRSEPALMERVVQEVRWMIRNDRNEATIRLEPDHLGSMRIKVVQQDATLRIEMTVDNPQARSLIESRLSDLQQRLNLHDLGAQQFSFNVNVQEGGGWESFKQAPQTARAMPYIPTSREPAGVEPAISAGRSRPIWGRAGVGIYV